MGQYPLLGWDMHKALEMAKVLGLEAALQQLDQVHTML